MQLRILGCSGGIGHGLRTTSYLVNDTILIDCGTGVGDLSLEEMKRIRHVFLTHSHLDHIAGLPLLVDTIFQSLTTPMIVHAQPETIQALKDNVLNWTIWPDFAALPDATTPVMVYEPITTAATVEVGGLTFRMIEVDHPVPSAAIRVTDGVRSFCFSSDTGPNETLWAGLNEEDGLDFLLMECAFPNENEELARLSKHYWPTQLAEDLKMLRHRPRIGITHLKPGGEADTWRQCRELIHGFDLFKVEHGQIIDV